MTSSSNHYDAIIIGSGICGTSIAFHLAARGAAKVLVLEQGKLCSGTTSHAPGLVGQLRADTSLMTILRTSVDIYRQYGGPGYQPVGSLRIASSPARWREILKQKEHADACQLGASLLDATQTFAMFPYFDPAGVEGSLYVPTDGSANAAEITASLREHALKLGVQFLPASRVSAFGDQAVEVSGQWLYAPNIVLATGIWSWPLAEMAGVHLPVVPMQHQVVWSEDLDWLSPERPLPNLRDPDNLVYFRQNGRQLVAGGYERDPRPFLPWEISSGVERPSECPFDEDHFQSLLDNARVRIPALRGVNTWSKTLNGLESFTPDGHFLLGPFPQKTGLWAACGFCAHGVSGSGGVGKVIADWITDGKPSLSVHGMEVSRYQDKPLTFNEAVESVTGIYSTYYDIDKSV